MSPAAPYAAGPIGALRGIIRAIIAARTPPNRSKPGTLWGRIKNLLATLALLAFGGLAWSAWFALSPVNLPSKQIDFSIQPGSGLRSAARQIEQAGVDMPAWKFALLGRVMGKATSIKAGSYEITRGVTPWQLLAQVTQGDFSQSEIAFIEGWTFSQMRAVLDASPELKHDSTGLSNEQIMASIGAPLQHPEGWFFPDTYLFAKGSSDLVVLKRSHAMMEKQLQAAWAQRSPRSSMKTPYEALILASIIEKETGRKEERARIGAVFNNRLRIGMLLQTDPTVIYGLGDEFKGNLKKEHLLRDGPFNTYTRGGLPPRPIAMAGMGSLLAAVNPAEGDELYFVARGDGSSQFSRTLAEHNRAVQKYQLSGKR